jgi:hypothetical protein
LEVTGDAGEERQLGFWAVVAFTSWLGSLAHGGFWVHQMKSVGGDRVGDSEHEIGLLRRIGR